MSLIWVGHENVSCERCEGWKWSCSHLVIHTCCHGSGGWKAVVVPLLCCLPLDPPRTSLTPELGLCVFSSRTNDLNFWRIPTPSKARSNQHIHGFHSIPWLEFYLWVPAWSCSPSPCCLHAWGTFSFSIRCEDKSLKEHA